jgi:HEAT repeat protein
MTRRPSLTEAAIALYTAVSAPAQVPDLPKAQLDALSGIDVEITSSLIQDAFDVDPVDELSDLAHDPVQDPGVRLRAYRALSLYPGAATILAADIAADSPPGGTEVLYRRAAIESLAVLQRDLGAPTHYEVLLPHLAAPHRDLRAATATALGVMQANDAYDALRERLNTETSEQVRSAISRALDQLVDPTP